MKFCSPRLNGLFIVLPCHRLHAGALMVLLTAALSACAPEKLAEAQKLKIQSVNRNGLQLSISVPQYEFHAGDEIPVHLSLQNTSNNLLSFLTINTALEQPLQADVFDVTHKDQSVAYIGITANRLPAEAKDILTLDSGEHLDTVVNLAEHYKLDKQGEYTIQYKPRQLVVEPRLQFELADLPSEAGPVRITIR